MQAMGCDRMDGMYRRVTRSDAVFESLSAIPHCMTICGEVLLNRQGAKDAKKS